MHDIFRKKIHYSGALQNQFAKKNHSHLRLRALARNLLIIITSGKLEQ